MINSMIANQLVILSVHISNFIYLIHWSSLPAFRHAFFLTLIVSIFTYGYSFLAITNILLVIRLHIHSLQVYKANHVLRLTHLSYLLSEGS